MRLIFDVPDFYSKGVATITLISTERVNGATLNVHVEGVDLSKSHHWKLSNDNKPEIVEEAENDSL